MKVQEISQDFEKICKPITKYLPIDKITYTRFYPDGKRYFISNDFDFTNHFVEKNDLFRCVPNPSMIPGMTNQVLIADINTLCASGVEGIKNLQNNILNDLTGVFGIQTSLFTMASKGDYVEQFSFFPSLSEEGAHGKLLSNYDVLQHFMFYFLDNGLDLIRNTPELQFYDKFNIVKKEEKVSDLCLQAMKTKRYFLNTDTNTYLTKREAQCAKLLCKNLNSREISDEMEISIRTVEEYIENIKLKTQINNKNQLQEHLTKFAFDRISEF